LISTVGGLGLAVQTYLETLHLTDHQDPRRESVRAEVKEKGAKWFNYIDNFVGSLDTGFRIWEAVYEGLRTANKEGVVAGDLMKEWDEAEKWLAERR
ncbi:RNA polymerase II transcription factor B 52 kDa subunit, partial [Ascosphaera pollenicola]